MVNRNSAVEKQRIADLMRLLPSSIDTVVDIGARDGFISKLLAERFLKVTALDLEKPSIDHRRIHCVQGDVTGAGRAAAVSIQLSLSTAFRISSAHRIAAAFVVNAP